MTIRQMILLLLGILLFASCKEQKPPGMDKTAVTQAQPAQTNSLDLPLFPLDKMKYIFDNATYVDYIFHRLPFSLSQDSKGSVQANIAMIDSRVTPQYHDGCVSIGREFFHVDGEIVMEAEVYCSEGCYAYVFYEDKKPAYVAGMTAAGQTFYQNMIRQALQASPNQ